MQWKGASPFEYDRKSIETETRTWSVFSNGGKATIEQLLASEINSDEQDCESRNQGFEYGSYPSYWGCVR